MVLNGQFLNECYAHYCNPLYLKSKTLLNFV